MMNSGVFEFGIVHESSDITISPTPRIFHFEMLDTKKVHDSASACGIFRFGETEDVSKKDVPQMVSEAVAQRSKRLARRRQHRHSRTLNTMLQPRQDILSSVKSFSNAFLCFFGADIHKSLKTTLGKHVLTPAPISHDLQCQLIELIRSPDFSSVKVAPVFHGTPAGNFHSIFRRGLLVPGQDNDLTVVNGAAHGTGIYTANVNASWLSAGFCSEPKMLVCAVFQTSEVKHVSDAQVVANAAHVLPLFVAEGSKLEKKNDQCADPSISLKAFPALGLLQAGIQGQTVSDLRQAGHGVAFFQRGGYSALALRCAGYPVAALKEYYSVSDLYQAAFDPKELLENGCTLAALLEVGCSVAQLRQLGFKAGDLDIAGVPLVTLRWAGHYTAAELIEAGFTASDLRSVCTAFELKGAGVTAFALRGAGFTATELWWASCTPLELKEAGFTPRDLKEAGLSSADIQSACYVPNEIPVMDDGDDDL